MEAKHDNESFKKRQEEEEKRAKQEAEVTNFIKILEIALIIFFLYSTAEKTHN